MRIAPLLLPCCAVLAACGLFNPATEDNPNWPRTQNDGSSSTTDGSSPEGEGGVVGEAGTECERCAPGLVCDANTKACVECIQDKNCLSGKCSDNKCAPCTENAECNGGFCVSERCVECTKDSQCPSNVCFSNVCVECTAEKPAACTGATKVCDDRFKECVECVQDSQCPERAPLCVEGTCSKCKTDAECANSDDGKACAGGECVECSSTNLKACADTDKPYCGDGYSCAECTDSVLHCSTKDPKCSAGKCESCANKNDCSGRDDTPACEVDTGDCVECTSADVTKCTGAGKVCLTGGTQCVECNADSDCPLPGKAKCNLVSHQCVPCDAPGQCDHVTVGANADLDVCSAGTCVQCTPATEVTECGAKACDPDLLECTKKDRNSVAICGTCRSDSECLTSSHKCVQVPFMGNNAGYHCMLQVPGAGCTTPPYQGTPFTATSKNGAASAQFCSHNTNVTTCEAILSLTSIATCSGATVEAACGRGARCESVNTAPNKCTYSCGSDAVCPVDFSCNEQSSGMPYCGGPGM